MDRLPRGDTTIGEQQILILRELSRELSKKFGVNGIVKSCEPFFHGSCDDLNIQNEVLLR